MANAVEAELGKALLQSVIPYIQDKPELQFFCNERTLSRYLHARNMNVAKASKLLMETLQWRHEERMHEISWTEVQDYARTGKVFRVPPCTVDGRPVLHLRPRHENTVDNQKGNVRHFAYQMETVTRYADEVSPDGKIVCIIDYTDFSTAKNPPLTTTRAVLKILQNHHPERLHEALLWHPPKIFSMLWKVIAPFVDPVTKKKMVFLEKTDPASSKKLAERLDVSTLDKCLGGTQEDSFDFEKYGALMETEEIAYAEKLSAFKRKAAINSVIAAAAVDGLTPATASNAAAAMQELRASNSEALAAQT